MSVRRYGKKWQVDVSIKKVDGTEVRRKKTVRTKREGEEYERRLREAILSGEIDLPKKETPTLIEFIPEFLRHSTLKNKPSTVTNKKQILDSYLTPRFGKLPLNKVGPREVEQLKQSIFSAGKGKQTIDNVLAVLSRILHYAMEVEVLEKIPKIQFIRPPPSKFRFLTFEETDLFLSVTEKYDRFWYPMLYLALRTGLRIGELLELRWYDLDFRSRKLIVKRAFYKGVVGPPKGGRQREVPLASQTVELLKNHRHLMELVFCNTDGGRIKLTTSHDALKRICRRSNLEPISWHVLRHTFASHLVMRGIPLKVVQELLGHSNMEMTLRYVHLTPDIKTEAVEVLDRSDNSELNTERPVSVPTLFNKS